MLESPERYWVFTLSSSSWGKMGLSTASDTMRSKSPVCLVKDRA